jgi:hypothetical protein
MNSPVSLPLVLTPEEWEVLNHLASAWNAYLRLPKPDPLLHGAPILVDDDLADFRKAIHDAQRIIQARPARRVAADGDKTATKDNKK